LGFRAPLNQRRNPWENKRFNPQLSIVTEAIELSKALKTRHAVTCSEVMD
jgi:hypothetical protein